MKGCRLELGWMSGLTLERKPIVLVGRWGWSPSDIVINVRESYFDLKALQVRICSNFLSHSPAEHGQAPVPDEE